MCIRERRSREPGSMPSAAASAWICEAVITEDEEIDIHTFLGGVELYVPSTVNVVVKSRSFIGGVGNETDRNPKPNVPSLHIVASNFFGGVSIKDVEAKKIS